MELVTQKAAPNTWEILDVGKFVSKPETWMWDQSYDGASASSDNHRVIFENAYIRVLEISIEPGDREDFHTHERNSIMIIDAQCDMRYYGADRNKKFEQTFPKDATLPTTLSWRESEGLHSIENIDASRSFHGIRIELKA